MTPAQSELMRMHLPRNARPVEVENLQELGCLIRYDVQRCVED